MDLALATCHPLPAIDADRDPLSRALDRAGVRHDWFSWDDPTAPFAAARRVLIRSTWNYVHHTEAFLAWADALGPRLLNPPALVRWNAHKQYLLELAHAGLAVTPTALVRRGASTSLTQLLAERGWDDVVVKPAVSAGSFRTRRVRAPVTPDDVAFLAGLVADRDALVQPYLPGVDGYGERSLVVFGGEVSHAIRKSPRFDGQHENVSAEAVRIRPEERAFAHRACQLAKERTGAVPTYARVDLVPDADGEPMLMELELIEPSLFLAAHPPSADRFVEVLRERLSES